MTDTDTAKEHTHEPIPGTMRDWAGWHRLEELAFDYPMTARCTCGRKIIKTSGGRYGWEDDDSVTQPEPAERVTVQYDLPGTHPVITVGISDQARVLIGERIGDSRAGVNWITRLGDDSSVDGLQQVLEQVRVEQARVARQVHPSDLRMALRAELAGRPGRWGTLAEIEAAFTTDRLDLIRELARMRDDGEVEFTGPRYRLAAKTSQA